ncbi:GNAT family acetyltransferase [Bacillus sp. FJAT-27264]|uniref:GNAT family N-acetyltransferase n=1 Tax=Paenibacillus sp. (strain DSM 101736 / FJAT-27264) TaxID=1850362 RepID=UPI000807A7A8|nr:GNAT family acetyltransferase [Bacillus sp. FJAT-27264]
MEASFPISEFRTREAQEALLDHPRYRLITDKNDEGSIIAFMAVWEFAEFRFVEHIAVDPAARGKGAGDKLMRAYIAASEIPVLLEVEPPADEWSRRRIGFYERLGFCINTYDYMQPPLREGQDDLPLKIMSHARPINEDEFNHFKDTVYKHVYKVLPIV